MMSDEKSREEKNVIVEFRRKKPKKQKEEIKLISVAEMMGQIFFGDETENQK